VRNNLVANTRGVFNYDVSFLSATNNHWGATAGPRSKPVDQVGNGDEELTAVMTPFATAPFALKAPIKPLPGEREEAPLFPA
jgi:hypothetical protein